MCLKLTENSKRNSQKIRIRDEKITVYKLVRSSSKGFTSIFFPLSAGTEYKLDTCFISSRQNKEIFSHENTAIFEGIHVFLRKNSSQINLALKYLKWDCQEIGPFALLECEANRSDLVSVGKWDHTDINCAVFTKITPKKVVGVFN